MNAKKLLKLAGVAAVIAAVIPYAHTRDEETREETLEALLWKMTTKPDPEGESKKKVDLTIGLRLPSRKQAEDEAGDTEEDDLFEDDEIEEDSDLVIDITIERDPVDADPSPAQPQ